MSQTHSIKCTLTLCAVLLSSPLLAKKAEPITYQTSPVSVPTVYSGDSSMQLTLEQIMAHPDWLGRQVESAFWGYDSNTVYYKRKRECS